MDRSKLPRSKGGKSHQPFPGSGDLIALGMGKTTRPPESESRSSSSKLSTSSSTRPSSSSSVPSTKSSGSSSSSSKSSGDKKRESASSPQAGPPKKVRLHGSSSSSSSSSSPIPSSSTTTTTFPSVPNIKAPSLGSSPFNPLKPVKSAKREQDFDFDISPQDLTCDLFFSKIEKAEKSGIQNFQPLMLIALKRLRLHREKPELKLCSGLLSAAQAHPQWFQHPSTVEIIYLIISPKKTVGVDVKTKLLQSGSPLPPLLICLIAHAYGNVQPWPTEFFQLWVEDACGDRIWVDRPQCKPFVDNIISSFDSVLPAASLLQPISEPAPLASGSSSPLGSICDVDSGLMDDILELCEPSSKNRVSVSNRCASVSQLESTVLDYAREVIHKKTPDIPKNVLRALASASGLPAVRAFSVVKLELWIHNQKCSRQAQELLLHLCVNAKAEVDNDLVIAITKLRLKTKPLIHFFANCVKEMARSSEANLRSILNFVVANELTSQRHPSNLQILSAIMLNVPNACTLLAEIYCDVLQKRDDQQGALRPVLREIVRASRFEIDLKTFVDGLVQLRDITWRDGDVRERTFMAITDLIVLCMFLLVSPTVRESAVLKGDSKDMSTMDAFHAGVADIQEAGICWLYSIVPRMFRPGKKEFAIALNKIMLRDPMNDLVSKDGWPPEPERSLFARLCLEVPLKENILMWTLLMGVSKEHPLNQPEILELVEFLVLRAASHKGISNLQKPEILSCLFRLCEYKHPENINLPLGYEPPKLAISKLYWKVWLLLCIISAYNPVSFGKMGWETYPTLKILMEMCMTNHFSYPTVASSETTEELHLKEMQISALEKAEILEFEQHLAAASSKQTITERNSLLLPQLIRMDPFGLPRIPPNSMLAQLKSLNEQMRLGHHFCRSRSPDFLLDLIQRNSQPMPWLSELVSEGPVEILPVQCLCELMLGQTDKIGRALAVSTSESTLHEKGGKKHKTPEDTKSLQLLQHLQKSIHDSESDDNAKEILEYFFRKLSSAKSSSRNEALQSLQMLLSNSSKSCEDDNWLLDSLPALPIFSEIQGLTTVLLRQAIQVENEPEWILRYLEFLTSWSHLDSEADMDSLAIDVAQLVVERNCVISALLSRHPKAYDALFEIFLNYMKKIREPHKETYKWSESQDQVLVQWPVDRLEATMNILVIHAIVILLTSYSAIANTLSSSRQSEMKKLKTGRGKSAVELKYHDLQDMWFPKTKKECPKGYLLNTSEEAVLFPDWIKLRMIRSNNSRLLESALLDLEADQLMLFVQSFGVPIKSMSALLYSLDKAVEQNPEKVTTAIGDPQYMNTLVELQWKRGANGGEKFSGLLKTVTGFEEMMDTSSSKNFSKPYIVRPPMPEALLKVPHTKSIKKENHATSLVITTQKEVSSPKQSLFKKPRTDNLFFPNLTSGLLCKASLSTISASLAKRRHTESGVESMEYEEPRGALSFNGKEEIMDSCTELALAKTDGIVDQLVVAEPSVLRSCLDIQVPLIFGRNDAPSNRPLLLNILTHQAGWKVVEFCLIYFLCECNTRNDPTSILDLVGATMRNPAFWQGGEKYIPKHQPEPVAFKLCLRNLYVMAEYIIEELACLERKTEKFSISNLLGPAKKDETLDTKNPSQNLKDRVRLWLLCCQHKKDVVNHLIHLLLSSRGDHQCTKKFAAQVYLEFPEVILTDFMPKTYEKIRRIALNDDLSCVLDTVSFNLITSIAYTQPGKEWAKKASHETETFLRKIADVHPVLLLRQLPLMGSLLEGRVHLDFAIFHAQNHHIPFKVYMGLWELMQPYIISTKHFSILKDTFFLYLKLFENYGHLKDYSANVRRFSILLHNFWLNNKTQVKEFLVPHRNILMDLATFKYYVDVMPLQNLIKVSFPPDELMPASIVSNANNFLMESVIGLVERMQHAYSSHDDMVPILMEIDSMSNRDPSILNNFGDKLKPLLLSHHESCRTLSFSLILKHVTYSPRSKKLYFLYIMEALEVKDAHLRDAILERIHEYIILAQEHAVEILNKLFDLGVNSNANTLPAITKTSAILSLKNT